ncbi:MAG: ADOP family duplicated permease [Vicinamibacterales bacterium]
MTDRPDWRTEIHRRLEPLKLPPTREAEIVEEVAQHLEDRYQELRALGRDDETAEADAWRELDEADVLGREIARLERPAPLQLPPPGAPAGGQWLGALWQDLRYALRTLRKSPAFTLTVVAALALSIGPTTAIVSIGNWLMWRPHPGVTSPDRLAVVWFGSWNDEEGSMRIASFTPDEFSAVSARATTASGVAGVQENAASLSFPDGVPLLAPVGVVTANFFDVLGVPLRAGRSFLPEEDRMPGVPVAIIGEGLARSAFGDPESALDKTILLNSRPFTVVGIAPSAFRGTTPTQTVDVWIPGAANSYMRYGVTTQPGSFYSFVMRVAPERSFSDLENELNVLVGGIAHQLPARTRRFATVKARVFPGLGVNPLRRERTRRTVTIMLAIGATLLLLGCANVANLLVFRATRREQEIAVRKALGASRARLVQVQLMEGVLLAAAGAALGVALALGLKQVMQQLLFPQPPGTSVQVPIDVRVLAVTLGAALVTGILAAAAPAWLAVRDRLVSLGTGGTRSSTRAPTLRGALASAQLALSLTLLVGALLLVTTLRNLRAIDLGFEPANLTAMWVTPGTHGFDQARTLQYFREVLASLSAHGEFEGVALASSPFESSFGGRAVSAPGAASSTRLEADSNRVTHDYFAVMRVPMLRGRAFTAEESLQPGGDPPVIVNATLAMRLYGTIDVVGRGLRIPISPSRPGPNLTIVGVAGDVRSDGLTSVAPPFFYQPIANAYSQVDSAFILVRSPLPAARVGEIANTIASRTNSNIPVTSVRSLETDVDRGLSQERLFAWMLSLLGGLGFVLASLGLYGLVAQTTLERRREFGIRMAIGAGRRDIIRLVARYAVLVSVGGVAAGLALAFVATRLVESMLFGVSRLSPGVYAGATLTLVVMVALACVGPALRALRVQPVEVLRAE